LDQATFNESRSSKTTHIAENLAEFRDRTF